MKTVNVSSSNINSVSYDDKKSTMRIKFHNGAEYEYDDVPEGVFENLCSAKSCGSYFHKNVKDTYAYRRL